MLLLALLACRTPAPSAPETPVTVAPSCLVTWQRASSASILAEQRGSGAASWRDFAERYSAADPVGHVPVKHTSRFQVGGKPVIWFTPDHSAAVVDAAAFGDLSVVDATAIPAGQSASVGTVRPAAREALGDRGVVELLVEADAIRVYAHIGGELCLRSESTEGGYAATFTGEHVYFTNEENRDALAFVVRIAPDGAVTVTGGP